MNPLVPIIGEVVGKVSQLADDLFTSDEERARAGIDAYKAEIDRMQGHVEINKIEAGHRSPFVAGWRPAVGWVGVIAMLYQFVAYPFLTWAWTAMQAAGFEVPDVQNLGGAIALFMKDPDGIRFEITYYPPGMAVVD